jgi:hypothetical protein
MTTGLKIWGPSNELWMDSSLVTWNLVGSYEVPANTVVSGTVADLPDREFIAVQIPLEVPKVQDYTYEKTISISGNTVTAYGGNQLAAVVVLCR